MWEGVNDDESQGEVEMCGSWHKYIVELNMAGGYTVIKSSISLCGDPMSTYTVCVGSLQCANMFHTTKASFK